MAFREAIRIALQSLWANKLPSVLTLIGMVIGVASVIMVMTLVAGVNKFVATKIYGYGADVFTASKQPAVVFSDDVATGGCPGHSDSFYRAQRPTGATTCAGSAPLGRLPAAAAFIGTGAARRGRINSMGMGKTMVEFWFEPMSSSVCM